jgi:hypothetical protein
MGGDLCQNSAHLRLLKKVYSCNMYIWVHTFICRYTHFFFGNPVFIRVCTLFLFGYAVLIWAHTFFIWVPSFHLGKHFLFLGTYFHTFDVIYLGIHILRFKYSFQCIAACYQCLCHSIYKWQCSWTINLLPMCCLLYVNNGNPMWVHYIKQSETSVVKKSIHNIPLNAL